MSTPSNDRLTLLNAATYHTLSVTMGATTVRTRWPSPGEDARRAVRHGYADVLAWLGEDVGPRPGDPVVEVTSDARVTVRRPETLAVVDT